VRSRTERGERGDREDVLTKGGDGGRRPESGRRRTVDRRPHTGGQARQRRVRHGRQYRRRVLGTWCQEVGRQAVEVVPHDDEHRQQGRFKKKLAVVNQYSTENGHVRLADLRFTKQDAKRQNGKETTRRM
jgi:hypothetical protein